MDCKKMQKEAEISPPTLVDDLFQFVPSKKIDKLIEKNITNESKLDRKIQMAVVKEICRDARDPNLFGTFLDPIPEHEWKAVIASLPSAEPSPPKAKKPKFEADYSGRGLGNRGPSTSNIIAAKNTMRHRQNQRESKKARIQRENDLVHRCIHGVLRTARAFDSQGRPRSQDRLNDVKEVNAWVWRNHEELSKLDELYAKRCDRTDKENRPPQN